MSRGSGARVLLLTFARRGEEQAIRHALARLRSEIADADVFAVGTPVSTPVLRDVGITSVITYDSKSSARSVVWECRSRRPERAAIVYWGPPFGGHLKLELLALLSGAGITHRFVPGSDPKPIGRLGLTCSVGAKCLRALLCAAAGGLICGAAFVCLLLSQGLTGGGRARRS